MDEESGSEFLDLILPMLKELNVIDTPADEKIVQFLQPDELEAKLNLKLTDAVRPRSQESLIRLCREFIRHSVKTSHRGFYNQLYGGVDPYGVAGAWITEALNTSQYTYEVAPCFVLAERAVLNRAKELFGGPRWKDGDGLFCPGGSYANMLALALARDNAPVNQRARINSRGLNGAGEMTVYTSEMSHYSLSKSCALLGIGKDNLIKVKCDDNGSMLISDLENLLDIPKSQKQEDPYKEAVTLICNGDIQHNIKMNNFNGLRQTNFPNDKDNGHTKSRIPIMINATAGTTVRGAFDDLEKIADICEKHDIWMHVDACWGGSLMLSDKHKHLLKGIERADSISWNPHKMLGAPLQCSMFLVKKKGLLHKCNSLGADYLFQPDKYYDVSYDTGDMTMQCGRKTDAFKLLLMWLARGEESFSERVDNCMECCQYLRERVRTRPGYIPVSEGEQDKCTNVCFWYVPECMRDQDKTEEWWDRIHKVTSIIKKKLVMSGTLMIGYAPLPVKIDKHSNNFEQKSYCPKHNYNMISNNADIIVNNIQLNSKHFNGQGINSPTNKNADKNSITHQRVFDINPQEDSKINGENNLSLAAQNYGYLKTENIQNLTNIINDQNNLDQLLNNGNNNIDLHEHTEQSSKNILNLTDQNTENKLSLTEQNVSRFETENIQNFVDEKNIINCQNSSNLLLKDQDKINNLHAQLINNLTSDNNTIVSSKTAVKSNIESINMINSCISNSLSDKTIHNCQKSEDKYFIKKINAFRIVNTCHPPPTFKDMLFILREIERVGHDIVI